MPTRNKRNNENRVSKQKETELNQHKHHIPVLEYQPAATRHHCQDKCLPQTSRHWQIWRDHGTPAVSCPLQLYWSPGSEVWLSSDWCDYMGCWSVRRGKDTACCLSHAVIYVTGKSIIIKDRCGPVSLCTCMWKTYWIPDKRRMYYKYI